MREKMFLRSYFYLLFIVVELVSGTSAVGLEVCKCKCNNTKSEVCDELLKVKTATYANVQELVKWKKYVPFIERKHHEWMSEDLLNSTSVVEDSERRLNDLINRVEQHTNDLQTDRKAWSDFEDLYNCSLSDVKKETAQLETKVEQLKNDLQIEIQARLDFEELCNSSTSEMEKRNAHLETKLKRAEQRLDDTEEEVLQLKTDLQVEREARLDFEIKMAEIEKTVQDVLSKAVTLESRIKNEIEANIKNQEEINRNVSNQLLILGKKDTDARTKLSNVEGSLQDPENQTLNFESAIKAEKEAREKLDQNLNERLQMLENQTENWERAIKEEQAVRQEMKLKLSERLQKLENQTENHRRAIVQEKGAREEIEKGIIRARLWIVNEIRLIKKKNVLFHERLEIVENQTQSSEPALKDYEKAREELEQKWNERLKTVENQIESCEQTIKEEQGVRQEMEEGIIRSRIWIVSQFIAFEKSNTTIYEKLQLVENRTRSFDPEAEKEAREELEARLLRTFTTEMAMSKRRYLDLLQSVEERAEAAEEGMNRLWVFKNTMYEIIENLCDEYHDLCVTHGIAEKLLKMT